MKPCSRCGSRYPNAGCYVCASSETHPETPDREGGSLLKTMNPDTTRTCASFAFVACIVTFILLAATGCRDFEGYVAISILAVMAAFIGITQDS